MKYDGNELKYLAQVLFEDKHSATQGDFTTTLEKAFANKFNKKYGIAFNSGTSTLHAALEAVGVRAGDEVISPALTVIMNTAATLHANAIPVYADVSPYTFTIDPESIKNKITKKTKAIMTVSVYGVPCDMKAIMEISKRHGIPVIEDNAECFLGVYNNKIVGEHGDMSSFSFETSKHLSCGEGGILITDNADLAVKARKLGGHGFKALKADEGKVKLDPIVFKDPLYKRHDSLGWNYRLSELCSAVALGQLEQLEDLVQKRYYAGEIISRALNTGQGIFGLQTISSNAIHSYWSVAARFNGSTHGVSWKEFQTKVVELGGEAFYSAWSVPYLEPLMQTGEFRKRLPEIYGNISYKPGLCPIAESLQKNLMVFQTNYNKSEADKQAEILEKAIRELFK